MMRRKIKRNHRRRKYDGPKWRKETANGGKKEENGRKRRKIGKEIIRKMENKES